MITIRIIGILFCIASPILLFIIGNNPRIEARLSNNEKLSYTLFVVAFLGTGVLFMEIYQRFIFNREISGVLGLVSSFAYMFFLNKYAKSESIRREYELDLEFKRRELELKDPDANKRKERLNYYTELYIEKFESDKSYFRSLANWEKRMSFKEYQERRILARLYQETEVRNEVWKRH